MNISSPLIDRFVVGVDVETYSTRNVRRQVRLQEAVDEILANAAEGAGLDRSLWERQPGGDGEFAALPAGVDLLAVVRAFVRNLDQLLCDHNEDHSEEMRVRLRVAMHIGTITPARLGGAGDALITLSRLLDSPPVRRALTRNPAANLALILSSDVYRKVVLSEMGGLRPNQFTEVQVEIPAKRFHETAYVHLPGVTGTITGLAAAAPGAETPAANPAETPTSAESAPGKAVYNTFTGPVNMQRSILGFSEEGT